MGSTYLELTNRLLRRINEVELTETNFASTRGIQSVAKDCVKDSIDEINQQKWQWPFLAVQHNQLLQVGENEYAWPSDFQSVDWNSFQIRKDDALDQLNTHLKLINRDEWYTQFKDADEDSYPDGLDCPMYVFRSHGTGFGVTPVPDELYTIEFRYYKFPSTLSLYNDVCDIPTEYNNIILWGSLYHMNLFRENPDGYNIAESKFRDGIKSMYHSLVGSSNESLIDTRVNFGGPIQATSEFYKI